MTIASDIIARKMPDLDAVIAAGDSLDDIDEYGFTPLIEAAITRQPEIAKALFKKRVDINKPDVTGRTALHWAVDNDDLEFCELLLNQGANANAYTRSGLSVLVYPVLREQQPLKQLLYRFGAKLDFALDFILAKLIGHRFELAGDVDIINAQNEFIEMDYEGFILEFTVAVLRDSLRRFTSSYSTRHLRKYFHILHYIMDGFNLAGELIKLQQYPVLEDAHYNKLRDMLYEPILFLPAASSGHAMGFIRYRNYFAKIDRGENSKKEGSANIYRMGKPEHFNLNFLQQFMLSKQKPQFFHQKVNQILDLKPLAQFPMTSQIAGNCSWANIQGIVPVAYSILTHEVTGEWHMDEAETMVETWTEWDKDRALDEVIQRFYLANPLRKASIASMLGAILFQTCDYDNDAHMQRAEKILPILTIEEYRYILTSYLDEYCVRQLTFKGNNLLKILDECNINPNIGVNPIATPLPKRKKE